MKIDKRMRIPIITKYLERRSCTHLMQMMRGYRKLRDTGRIGLITELKEDFANTLLIKNPNGVSKLIYGAGYGCAELIVRQYLLKLVGGLNFNKAVLQSFGAPGTLSARGAARPHRMLLQRLVECSMS